MLIGLGFFFKTPLDNFQDITGELWYDIDFWNDLEIWND